MFARVYAMMMAVILLVVGVLTGISWVTLRDQQISARLDELKKEGREVAYLASRTASDLSAFWSIGSSDSLTLLNWKADSIYDEFGAYILVVDRRGNVLDNMQTAWAEDPSFVESLDTKEISDGLRRVLGGEEIAIRTDQNGEPAFTVGVPYIRNETVTGAVFIRTKAQTVEAGADQLLRQVLLVALAALLIAAVCVWFYVRSVVKPLKQMTAAAGRMAEDDFSARAEESRGMPELRELGHAFNKMADQLSETERSRREFVANVSHELRSPITSISGFVEGIRDGTIPPEEQPKYLAIVSDETKRLGKLIGDLLALSRLERDDAQLHLTVFDICELLRRAVIRRMNDLDSRRLEVDCDFEEEHMAVQADSDRIEQVAVNLLDNAIKFTPDGGRITLRVKTDGDLRLVTVADNGPGVLPENRSRIFDRFFTEDTAHTAGKGTGLGLSICMRIMQMHGQSLKLDDTAEGASFTFTLDCPKTGAKSASGRLPAEAEGGMENG